MVNEDGIIAISTVDKYVGYDMHMGTQSSEFLCLLDGTDSYLQDMREISYDDKTQMWYAGAALKSQKGFLQFGMNAQTRTAYCRDYLRSRIKDAKVERTGSYLLINSDDQILGSYKNSHNNEKFTSSADIKK